MIISNTATRKAIGIDERQVHTPDRYDYVSAGPYNTRQIKALHQPPRTSRR